MVFDSGTSCGTDWCRWMNLSNCSSVMTNVVAFLRASGPTFSPSISRHWNTCNGSMISVTGIVMAYHENCSLLVPSPFLAFQWMSPCMASDTCIVRNINTGPMLTNSLFQVVSLALQLLIFSQNMHWYRCGGFVLLNRLWASCQSHWFNGTFYHKTTSTGCVEWDY